jgi:hypothetical protein
VQVAVWPATVQLSLGLPSVIVTPTPVSVIVRFPPLSATMTLLVSPVVSW